MRSSAVVGRPRGGEIKLLPALDEMVSEELGMAISEIEVIKIRASERGSAQMAAEGGTFS